MKDELLILHTKVFGLLSKWKTWTKITNGKSYRLKTQNNQGENWLKWNDSY